jgi:hypothetical protein
MPVISGAVLFFRKKVTVPYFRSINNLQTSKPLDTMSTGKKSFVCSICHCKHQMARGQQCKQLKHNLPIFTTFVRAHDASNQTSFARNVDESLESVFAIRRLMAFMHSNVEEYRAWSLANPTLEIGAESSVIAADFARTEPARSNVTTTSESRGAAAACGAGSGGTFLPEPAERGSLGHVCFGPAAFAAPTASAAATSAPSDSVVGEKGPAPPCLSYEFLSKAPKITSLVLKKN